MPDLYTNAPNLYVHVPFCSGKCSYCGFYSEPFSIPLADRFLEALEVEIRTTAGRYQAPETLYIGGGTPSLLTTAQWDRLCGGLQEAFKPATGAEWTVEANPGTVTPDTASLWRHYGVNRISLGVQSLCDATLARIHRRHNAQQAEDTLKELRQAGFERIGMDLITCLPGVSPTEWEETLAKTIALQPGHISVYACSIEPGTLLERSVKAGHYQPADEDIEAHALDLAADRLDRYGFEHYEVSNFARPGERCRYNCNVWNGADYIGFGPAAASRAGWRRWTHPADLDAYCRAVHAQTSPRDIDTLTPARDAAERLMFRFRLSDPVDLDAFAAAQGTAALNLLAFWRQQLGMLAEAQLVISDGNRWRHTRKGRDMADTIAEALLPAPPLHRVHRVNPDPASPPDGRPAVQPPPGCPSWPAAPPPPHTCR